jgi:hypothetical protein
VKVWQDGGVKRPSSKIRTARRHRTPKEIAGILRDQRRSGLSLFAFARKEGLCYGSLLRWRSLLPAEANDLASTDLGADPRFVPVQIESEGLSGDYVLSWPGGRSLRIPLHFEADSLRRLLSVLEAVR